MGCAGSKNRLSVVQRPPRAPVEGFNAEAINAEGDDGIVIEPQRLAAAEAELAAGAAAAPESDPAPTTCEYSADHPTPSGTTTCEGGV